MTLSHRASECPTMVCSAVIPAALARMSTAPKRSTVREEILDRLIRGDIEVRARGLDPLGLNTSYA